MASRRSVLVPLAALVALGAFVRFWEIGRQSYWGDESYTIDLLSRGFGDMLSTLPKTESTPPLYYSLAWLWAQVFGTGEAGLRSLSALLGTLAVAAAYAAAREFFSHRAGLLAALLVAVNPFFVWYSQEARSYSLLVLLSVLSLLLLARALRLRTPLSLALWALVAVLSLATHYFGLFLVIAEAVWLVYALRRRAALLAVGAVGLGGLALAPLANSQRSAGYALFIGDYSMRTRLLDLPKKFVTGELGSPIPALGAGAALIVVGGLVLLAARAEEPSRRRGLALLAVTASVLLMPLVLAAVGIDYVFHRNLISMYVPFALALAAGFAAGGRGGIAAAGVLAITALVVNFWIPNDTTVQREDWRSAARALGPVREARAMVISPTIQAKPLALYTGPLPPLFGPIAVREVYVLGGGRPPRFPPPRAPRGFREVSRLESASWLLIRYRSEIPVTVDPPSLDAAKLGKKPAVVVVQHPRPPTASLVPRDQTSALRTGPLEEVTR